MSIFDIGGIVGTQTYSGVIDNSTPFDLYNFSLKGSGSFQASLAGLSNNADVQLLGSSGNILYRSTNSGTNPEQINIDNLAAGNYSLRVFQVSGDTKYNLNLTQDNKGNRSNTNSSVDPITGMKIESGYFTVGQTGEVGIDYVFDGGWYKGETAIFSLEGMDKVAIDSKQFIKEAAKRALSNSPQGYVVISDPTEGAKFTGNLKDGNFNEGPYLGNKKFAMKPGDKFGLMLVPNGKVQEVFNNPAIGGDKLPLFSLVTGNPKHAFKVGQIADLNGAGTAFGMEDLPINALADKDFNDIIFKLNGATGKAASVNGVINPVRDWRDTKLGKEVLDYLKVEPKTDNPSPIFKPGELLVKFKSGVDDTQVSSVAKAIGAIGVERTVPQDPLSDSALQRWRVVKFDPAKDLQLAQTALSQNSSVEAIQLNYALSSNWTPSDPNFNTQWGLNNTGQYPYVKSAGFGFISKPDADIDAPEAWDIQKGSKSVTVAVIDTGVDYNHQDLAANIWKNSGEIPGNGIDDDRNSYVDDYYGYDFGNKDSDPMEEWTPKDNTNNKYGHGTHIAGIIGAASNNNGVVGVSPNVSIMSLKHRDADGIQYASYTIKAIDYAIKKGAKVINASFGTDKSDYYPVLLDAISDTNKAGVLFVASAGNDAKDTDINPQWPANYDFPNVISVAATDDKDQLALFLTGGSNYGKNSVDLGAPGSWIYSTMPSNQYDYNSGTSMAAPMVAGAAALLLAENPNLTPSELKNILMTTTDPLSSLQGKTVSGGRLNLQKAIQAVAGPKPTVTIAASVPNAFEGGSFGQFTISRTGSTTKPLTVNYSVTGTATNGTDYNSLNGSVTIPVGATSTPIAINVIDDSTYEGTENVSLTLTTNNAYNLGTSTSSIVSIYDNETPPKSTISLTVTDNSASEKKSSETQDPGQFTITRTGGDNTKAETIYYTLSGAAQNGLDYSPLSGSVTIAAGATSAVIPIAVVDDSIYEGSENLTLTLSSNSAYNLGNTTSGTVAITDNETPPKSTINLSVTDNSASEKTAAEIQDPGQFTVTRTGGDNTKAETIYYTLSGTAQNSLDYTQLSGSVTFTAGATSAVIPITVVEDSIYEGTENLTLTLSTNSAYNLGSTTSGTVAIADNETPPKSTINLSVTDNSASEKTASEIQDSGQFTITRTGGDNTKAETIYYTLSGTAQNGQDYSLLSGNVTIAAGATSAVIPVNISDDYIYEGNENLTLTLSTNSAYNLGSTTSGTVAIADNETPPKSTINLSVTDNSASEKYWWETQDPGQFTITRTGGDNSKVETVYYTLSGTAQNGQDYNPLSGSVTFTAGATSAIIPINISDDSIYEGSESISLTLSTNSTYNLGSTTSGTVSITDNETPPKSTISLSVTDNSASEKYWWETQDPGQFTITRTGGDNTKAETIYYTLIGTAQNSQDYTQLSGSVTIAAGATSAVIPINISDDSIYEGTENLTLTLSSNSAYNLGSTTSETVSISDNETPPKSTISLSVTDNSASEKYWWETQDPGQFTITRTGGDNTKAETIYYTLSGTAQNGQDYSLLSGNVTIAAGATSAVIPVNISDDSIYEGTENLTLTLSTNSAYNLGSTTSGTVAIADNETPPKSTINLSVTDNSASEKNAAEIQDTGQFIITRTGGDNTKAETVYYALSGTAQNSQDYSQLSGSVTFAAGDTSAIIPITIVDDSIYEGNENLTLTLSTNSTYNLGTTTSGTVSIVDNETSPKSTINLSVTDNSASEKNASEIQDPGQFTITRTGGDNSKAETIYYGISGTAQYGQDYSLLSGNVTIAAGSDKATIDITPINDTAVEGNETVVITLATLTSNTSYNIGSSSSGTVTIADNDQPLEPTVEWIRQLGSPSRDDSRSVAVDNAGNVYIAGSTEGSLGGTNQGTYDAFLSKYNSSGILQWTQQLGISTSGQDAIFGTTVDGSGNVYVSGWNVQTGALLAKYNSNGTQLWTKNWGSSGVPFNDVAADNFGNVYTCFTNGVVKYDSNGNVVWTRFLSGFNLPLSYAIETDKSGNVYTIGYDYNFSTQEYDSFAIKYDSNGNQLWTQKLATSKDDISYGIAVDSFSNVYISGLTQGSLGSSNAGSYDAFLVKYDSNGIMKWTRQLGTAGYEGFNDVSVDKDGNVYATGSQNGDVWVVKHDSSGNFLWTKQLGSSSADESNGIVIDSNGKIYLTGVTYGSLGGTNAGSNDAWVAKLNP